MQKTLKRLLWRLSNLTATEFVKSYYPDEVNLKSVDIERYSKLYDEKITPSESKNPKPFILIKPSGLSLEDKIKEFLTDSGAKITQEHNIEDYAKFAVSLYDFGRISGDSIPGNYLWLQNDLDNSSNNAKCLVIEPSTIYEEIRAFKKQLRRSLGEIKFSKINYKEFSDTAFSSFIHMPETHEIDREYSILEKYLKLQGLKSKFSEMHAYSVDYERALAASKCIANNSPAMTLNGRGVLFLTERCNMDCLYCKRSSYRKPDFSVQGAKELISQWADAGCSYVHLTGGEATVFEGLENIVVFAKSRGMTTSMSTNGMAHPDFYRELVHNGAKYFFISLDTNDESECDNITRSKGSFRKILASIGELVKMREAGRDVYVTINVLVGDYNFSRFESISHFIMELNPDDFKLIPTTRFMDQLVESDMGKIHEMIHKNKGLKLRYPMFFYRLEHFDQMRGLVGKEHEGLKCAMCIDERTCDPEFYYPCGIYLREGGKPIGSHKQDDFKTQAEKLLNFAQNHDITKDFICRNYCCDITRDYNLAVRELCF